VEIQISVKREIEKSTRVELLGRSKLTLAAVLMEAQVGLVSYSDQKEN